MQPPTIPAADYWQTWGVLGICFMCALAAVVAWFWLVKLPHMKRKQDIELAREEKTLKVVDMLTETIPVMVTTQQEIVTSQRKLAEVADRMDLRQVPHSNECKHTSERVEAIARHLKVIT